jgi:hypothetical protein
MELPIDQDTFDGRFKLIVAPRPELYDLAADPGEARNLLEHLEGRPQEERQHARRLKAALKEAQRSFAARPARSANPADIADPELMRSLESLGYLSGSGTPEGQIAALIAQIEALVAGGDLAQNKANPLLTKLNQVLDKLEREQTSAACGQLGAFINQVNAYIGNGTLTAADGQALIDATNALRADLGC